MSLHSLAVGVLLVLGLAVELLCGLGLLVLRDPFERLHLLGPASGLGALAVAGAVALDTPAFEGGLQALLTALVLLVTNPVLTHATGRAATLRKHSSHCHAPQEPP